MAKHREPFSHVVCDKIRNLLAARKKAETKRGDLFKARDYAKDELDKTGKDEEAKRLHFQADYGKCVIEISQYDRAIKRIQTQLDDAVENADNEKLFGDDPSVDFAEMLAEPAKTPAKSDKPVGGPSAKEPPKKPAIEPAPVHQGVDMHLAASVNELDMPELHKGRLLHAGITTIADAIKLFEDETKHAGTVLNCGEKIVANIKKAVAAYRDTHRKATKEKFTTGTGED